MKVLVMDGVKEAGLKPLRDREDIELVIGSKMTEDELCACIGEYDAMIVRSATKVTAKVFDAGSKLKVVGRAGVGVDNIDLNAATRNGVLVVNAPDGNTIAACEHTLAMMFALARQIPEAVTKTVKEKKWDKKAFMGFELRGKTLAIIGMGRIGSSVAKRAHALEMEIVAYDPFISEAVAAELGVELGTLEEILPKADLITVHMPKTKTTYHMINKDTIALMKDGVYILNCARGGIIEENDLYQAMVDGKVAGAALDVFEEEPNETSPLLDLPGFIATPHLGASTKEAQLNVAVDVSAEIVNALTGKMVKNTVNIPSINPQTMSFVKPFLGLAEKLGSIQSQIIDGRAQKIEITYSGDLAKNNVKPMTTSLIKGFLEPVLKESVNFINAPHLAAERGIQIVEIKDAESTGYSNLISVKVSTENSTKSLAGTLFGKNEERLVMIDGYRIDAVPSPHMVYIPHMDKPRIIGPVGNLIGAHNINIAGMLVGRKELGGQAVMILSVDDLVPENTLEEIDKIDGILEVKMINL